MNNNNLPAQNNDFFKSLLQSLKNAGYQFVDMLKFIFKPLSLIVQTLDEESERQRQMYQQMYSQMSLQELLKEKRQLELDRSNVQRLESESRARNAFHLTQHPNWFGSMYMMDKGLDRRYNTRDIISQLNYHISLIDEELDVRFPRP